MEYIKHPITIRTVSIFIVILTYNYMINNGMSNLDFGLTMLIFIFSYITGMYEEKLRSQQQGRMDLEE